MNEFTARLWERLSSLWQGEAIDVSGEEMPEAGELLKDQLLCRRALRQKEGRSYGTDAAWAAVEASYIRLRKRQRRITLAKAAALVAIVLAPMAWILSRQALTPPTRQTAEARIIPGTNQAQLIFSNGEKMALQASNTGKIMETAHPQFENDGASGLLRHVAQGQPSPQAPKYNSLVVPKGGEYQLELSDGTRVWINSETTVRFPDNFAPDRRDVYLDGEAFFKVAKNEACPFYVHIGNEQIKVVGTSFNVSAYHSDDVWHTTLIEGSIVAGSQMEYRLKPAEQLSINRQTGARTLRKVDTWIYTSWMDGLFRFDTSTFEFIIGKLERWYDFHMTYDDDSIRTMRFTGFVDKHEPIEKMLELLGKTSGLQFEVKDRIIKASFKASAQ